MNVISMVTSCKHDTKVMYAKIPAEQIFLLLRTLAIRPTSSVHFCNRKEPKQSP